MSCLYPPCSKTKPQDRRHVLILTTYMLGFEADKTARFRGLRVSNDEALMSFGQMISRRLKASAAQYFPSSFDRRCPALGLDHRGRCSLVQAPDGSTFRSCVRRQGVPYCTAAAHGRATYVGTLGNICPCLPQFGE